MVRYMERVVIREQLKAARKRMKLTQGALAKRAGVHRVTVVKLESGKRTTASFSTVHALAGALQVPISALTVPEGVSPVEPEIEAYLASPYAQIDQPTDEEIDRLRRLPGFYWEESPPTPASISLLIQSHRKSAAKL
jgi:transcriptional regulator with XRE-family HTH domain